MLTLISQLRTLAIEALKRMYRPDERLFAFRLRRGNAQQTLEGTSVRYTAIALIGLATEPEDVSTHVLGGQTAAGLCDHLLRIVEEQSNLGDTALALWAARVLNRPGVPTALRRLETLEPCTGHHPTVELAWTLSALTAGGDGPLDEKLSEQVARRLMGTFRAESSMFAHWPNGCGASRLRSHVACFADLVYPTQALSFYGKAVGDAEAIETARRCAERICSSQGPHGQWWWHFDVRTGRTVEGYPVYAVHQDAMAPMALFAARDACGSDYDDSIERGLRWLAVPPEIAMSLIDTEEGIIWRKVGRCEPGKLSRSLQAAASRLHRTLRVPGLDRVFTPGRIDYESRPYHMGWLLHVWSGDRGSRVLAKALGERHDRIPGNSASPSSV